MNENPFSPKRPTHTERAKDTIAAYASEKVVPKTGNEDRVRYSSETSRRLRIESLAEYVSAGKNLANFCKRLSRREKKPVFVLNNPRTGAFLQLGFKHWLGNFSTEQEATQFINDLESDPEYSELQKALQEQIEYLKTDLRKSKASPSSKEDIERLLELPDPTSDINLELYFRLNPPASLLTVYSTKDKMRAVILKHAKHWLDAGRIDSFVYPINHWKKSGGAMESETDSEMFVVGEAKLAESVSLPNILIVGADVHGTYPDDLKHRGGQFPLTSMIDEYKDAAGLDAAFNALREIGREPKPDDGVFGDEAFTSRYLRNPDSFKHKFYDEMKKATYISRGLEYPGSENASGKLHSVQKVILDEVSKKHPKIISLQVLFPSQKTTDETFIELENGKFKRGHSQIIMDNTGESNADPFYAMKKSDLNIAFRKATERMRGNPSWINKFKDRIMLEPNYTYAGMELEDEITESGERRENLLKTLAIIASGCQELSDWNPEFDHPKLMQLIERIKTESKAFLERYHSLKQSDDEEQIGKLIVAAPVFDTEEFRQIVTADWSRETFEIADQIVSKLGLNLQGGTPTVDSIAYKLDPKVWERR